MSDGMTEAFGINPRQKKEMVQEKVLTEYKKSLKNLKSAFPEEWQSIVIKMSAKTLKKKKKKNGY